MKLKFGKKALALLLMLTVALSLCTVSAWAEDEGGTTPPSETTTPTEPTTPSEPDTPTTPAVTGITLNKPALSLNYGGFETLTATVTADEGASTDVTWSSSAEGVATVSNGTVTAVKVGTATITATAGDKSATCAVTVSRNSEAKVTNIAWKTSGDGTKSVPYGISEASVQSQLAKIQLTLTWDQGGTSETTGTWAVSSGSFNSTDMTKSYEFVPTITEATADACANSAKVTVSITKAKPTSNSSNAGTITVLLGTSEAEVIKLLPTDVAVALDNGTTKTFNIGSYTNGTDHVNGCFASWTTSNSGSSTAYNPNYTGTYTFTAKATSHQSYEMHDVTYTVKVVDSDFKVPADHSGASLKDTSSQIEDLVKGMFAHSVYEIRITDLDDMDGGTLYLEDDGVLSAVSEDDYELSTFAKMIYYPNGNGEKSVLDYTAYTSDSDEHVRGSITFTSDAFMLITAEMTTDDYLDLDADDFLDAFLAVNDDYESLTYITFSSPGNSKSKGYFYMDYASEGDDADKIASNTKLYFDADDADGKNETYIDNVTYVPGSSMKSGTYEFTFKAYGRNDRDKEVKNIPGYLRIIITEAADITIDAAKEQTVSINPDLFKDYLAEKKGSKAELAYVVISNAPRTAKQGYLITNDARLTKSGDKTFYLDSSDVNVNKKKYDLNDLYFEGGTQNGTVNATFTIYYYKTSSTTKATALDEGTIDFVTGVAGASTGKDLTATLTASQTMPFADEINAFLKLQSDMDYMVFTDLPRTGKLVYNWGASGQTDVTANTAYYISGTNKLLLKNVTFVPGYTSSKSSNTVTFGYKAVSTKGKTVTGTFTITVSHAYVSAQFYDVTNYLYADSVDFLYNQKITTGTSATTFNPNGQVTRMEFVTFLYRAAGSPSVTGLTNKFTDVSATTHSYYYNAILWATANGITTGTSATTFNPTGVVTHSELLTFLYRYDVNYLRHSSTTGSLGSYSGWSSVATWAQTGAKWAAGKGILTDSTTPPASNGTRATVALWMHRMLTL